ncbi:MAG: hypothetical protein KBG15_01385 [Kofleriaceae bacterium]|nr:hypothetical protein [Kofleriaceae bacterium]
MALGNQTLFRPSPRSGDADRLITMPKATTFENFAAAMMHGEILVSIRTGEFAEAKSQASCDGREAVTTTLWLFL